MKNTKILLAVGLALLAGVITSFAQTIIPPGGYSVWTVGGASSYTWSSKTNFLCAPPWSSIQQSRVLGQQAFSWNTPVCTYVNATSDLATGTFAWWAPSFTPLNCVSNTTTALYLSSTNGIVANNPVVIVHAPNPSAPGGGPNTEIRMLTAVATTGTYTNIYTPPAYGASPVTNWFYDCTLSAAPTYNVTNGDTLIPYTQGGTIAFQTNSAMANYIVNLGGFGSPVLSGNPQCPLLISISGTTTFAINVFTGTFAQ